MKTIRLGSSGKAVRRWQLFLLGQTLFKGAADGVFNAATDNATRKFQQANGLVVDGIVGNRTWGAAMLLGLDTLPDDTPGKEGPNWPPYPQKLKLLLGDSARRRAFGVIEFHTRPPKRIAKPSPLRMAGTNRTSSRSKCPSLRELENRGSARS